MSQYEPIDASARATLEKLPPWRRRLFLFLRAVAAFLLIEGVIHWAVILGIGDSTPSHFEQMSTMAQAAVVWAAIIDPIAGVGLWLRAGWAVVLWLIATLTQVMFGALAPAEMTRILIFTMVELGLVVAYAVLSIKAAQESDER
ncbi:DUF6163 family protein [Xanthobacter tagetidis]|jgi:hypothetical protein|uniref:DUF2127 domain-containing protein n=1 Tax=Xanthobacter tagetidis TaxID=60216 RepID=A0A3L7A071_9HYPH|nr:DUF6163 family protein [Xanthobacter tagetidis]MBB6310194.1 fatty acid desaturase [Xanthobacter tagetidis]RLP72842.1 hypothetical protein D9R14_21155 [Xanthobacter tagetidis]